MITGPFSEAARDRVCDILADVHNRSAGPEDTRPRWEFHAEFDQIVSVMTDTPTQPEADAESRLLEAIIEDAVSQYWFDRRINAPDRFKSAGAQVIAALSDAGYEITRPAQGMVAISGLAARSIQYHLEQHGKRNAELDAAIVAADPQEDPNE